MTSTEPTLVTFECDDGHTFERVNCRCCTIAKLQLQIDRMTPFYEAAQRDVGLARLHLEHGRIAQAKRVLDRCANV
jgi:hypothetical protein